MNADDKKALKVICSVLTDIVNEIGFQADYGQDFVSRPMRLETYKKVQAVLLGLTSHLRELA